MKRFVTVLVAVLAAVTLSVAIAQVGGTIGGGPVGPGGSTFPNVNTVLKFLTNGYLGGEIKSYGGIAVSALATPTSCAVAKTGSGTGTTWGYRVSALSSTGETLACSQVTVSGNATLDATHYNTVTWSAVSGARGYYVYRTAAPGTPNTTGKVGTGSCTPTVVTGTSHVDNGLCADASSVLATATDAKITGAALSGNADTATALAANPTDCTGIQFANAIAANGNLTCAQPSDVTGNAATATALAADPADCGATQFAKGIVASGAATCAQPAVADISDISTNYCALAGCSMTGDLTATGAGVTATVANTGLGAASTTYDETRAGFISDNTTASTAGTVVQVSPSVVLKSHAWDTDTGPQDDTWAWRLVNNPTSAGTTSSTLSIDSATKAGAGAWSVWTPRATLTSAGALAVSSLSAAGGAVTSATVQTTSNITAGNNLASGNGKITLSYASGASGDLSANRGTILADSGSSMWLAGNVATAATAKGTMLGNVTSLTTEGAKLGSIINGTTEKSTFDKDGVWYHAYGSGQSADAGTLAKILITTLDDDSVYIIEARAEAIDQAATPSHIGAWTGTIVARRIDGTVTVPVDTWTELYDVGVDWATTPVSSTAANNLTITTPAAGGAIGTVNWKIYLVRIMKTSSANFTGVVYPLAN